MRVPDWIHHHFPKAEALTEMKTMLRDGNIHTVCEEAKCPNISDCFGSKTATFLILGDVCTRNCAFCGVKKGSPLLPDSEEPEHIAETVANLGLSHTVITSVTRDDLPDKGALQFINTVREIRKLMGSIPTIEVLIPQLDGQELREIIQIAPDVINHNIETVERLYPVVRSKSNYYKSLGLLKSVKIENNEIVTKSGFMLGFGEAEAEVIELMQDLRESGVDILTIGQYLRPSGKQVPVADYISPAKFMEYEETGYELGFKYIASGPYVRSSYKAQESLQRVKSQIKEHYENINNYSVA